MPCILGKDGKLKVPRKEKTNVWKECEEKLLNEKKDRNKSLEITKVESPREQVSTEDVMKAFALIDKGKAAEPSGVTVECLNVCKKESVRRLAEVARNILEENDMP